MKALVTVYIILYISTVASTQRIVKYDGECPKESPEGMLITFPHETDCDKFYVCIDGEKVPQECPDGLHFDPRQGTCDWPEIVDCKLTSSGPSTTERISTTERVPTRPPPTRPPQTPAKPPPPTRPPPTLPPHATSTERPITKPPPSVRPPQSTTPEKPITGPPATKPPQAATGKTTVKPPPTRPPHITTENLTIKPPLTWSPQPTSTEKPTPRPPATRPPQITTEKTTVKPPPTSTEKATVKPSTTKPPQTTTPRWDDPRTCIGKCPSIDPISYTVQLPNVRCDKFCKCSNGIAYVQSCPANLHYNKKLGVCDWPLQANCSGIGGIPITTTTKRPRIALQNIVVDGIPEVFERTTTPRWQNPSSCIGECPVIDPPDYAVQLPNKRCDKFCKCSNGIAYVQSCPAKLHYNKKSKVCDWPALAKCTGIGGIPSTITEHPPSFFQRMLHLW